MLIGGAADDRVIVGGAVHHLEIAQLTATQINIHARRRRVEVDGVDAGRADHAFNGIERVCILGGASSPHLGRARANIDIDLAQGREVHGVNAIAAIKLHRSKSGLDKQVVTRATGKGSPGTPGQRIIIIGTGHRFHVEEPVALGETALARICGQVDIYGRRGTGVVDSVHPGGIIDLVRSGSGYVEVIAPTAHKGRAGVGSCESIIVPGACHSLNVAQPIALGDIATADAAEQIHIHRARSARVGYRICAAPAVYAVRAVAAVKEFVGYRTK